MVGAGNWNQINIICFVRYVDTMKQIPNIDVLKFWGSINYKLASSSTLAWYVVVVEYNCIYAKLLE